MAKYRVTGRIQYILQQTYSKVVEADSLAEAEEKWGEAAEAKAARSRLGNGASRVQYFSDEFERVK